jgi:hypothetical protein
MSIFKNLKDPITDLIGLGIITLTLVEIYRGDITWLWEGYAGMGMGLILFMFPDDLVMEFLRKVFDKLTK